MNGIIVINKPKDYTSHDVVAKVKRILNIKKVGHTGTLDPNATGVLPLLLNDGTKLSKYLIEHDKEYEVTLKLGIKTDTADSEGTIIEEKKIDLTKLSESEIELILKSFKGKQEQIPPMYSAIKVNGKKLYEYARSGQTVELKPRQIEIYDINLMSIDADANEIQFKVSCSKGTYIRSLCEDIAEKFNTVGYMKELNRTKVGKFKIEQSINIDELENKKDDIDYLKKHIISVKEFFKDYPNIELSNSQLQKFLNGVKIKIEEIDGLYNIYSDGKYIGIAECKSKVIKRELIVGNSWYGYAHIAHATVLF